MAGALDKVVDAIDIETFLYCKDEEEAKDLAQALLNELNFKHGDIVFLEHLGWGARVRLRAYLHRPGDHYRWLNKTEAQHD
jgi:hypothetical protein